MPLVLTIDVEDWAQSTLDTDLPISDRAQRNMEHLLDLLDEHNRKTTCFVLGKFAERFPSTVKRIAEAGHEVASHGYGHVDVFRQNPQSFREDIRRSKQQLENMTGHAVRGYRAPDFSVVKNALWALDILAEEGFSYDTSINPAVAARFGIPDWPRQPVKVILGNGEAPQTTMNDTKEAASIVELPVATKPMLGRHWPVAGGGYHRLLPWFMIHHIITSALKAEEVFVAYCHPYEFDASEFKEMGTADFAEAHGMKIRTTTRLHQGIGRKGFESKFRRIIQRFDSVLARDIASQDWPTYERFPERESTAESAERHGTGASRI
jgi:polysaccharide deacetylase family protein (PEP-CTERM system associated)